MPCAHAFTSGVSKLQYGLRHVCCTCQICGSSELCWHVPCVSAQQDCTPGTGCCPYGRILASGTSCRKAEAECADEAQCDGVSPVCPGNPVKTMGTICRQPRKPCEQPATCDGEHPHVLLQWQGMLLMTVQSGYDSSLDRWTATMVHTCASRSTCILYASS
jgi:hypothetical protein